MLFPSFQSALVRKVIYTTNAIESLNSTYRKLNCQRSVFPSDTALFKKPFIQHLSYKNGLQQSELGSGLWRVTSCMKVACQSNKKSRKTGGLPGLLLTCNFVTVIYKARRKVDFKPIAHSYHRRSYFLQIFLHISRELKRKLFVVEVLFVNL